MQAGGGGGGSFRHVQGGNNVATDHNNLFNSLDPAGTRIPYFKPETPLEVSASVAAKEPKFGMYYVCTNSSA